MLCCMLYFTLIKIMVRYVLHQQRKAPDRPLEVISVTMSPSENLLVTGSGDSIAGICTFALSSLDFIF